MPKIMWITNNERIIYNKKFFSNNFQKGKYFPKSNTYFAINSKPAGLFVKTTKQK